MTPTTDQLHALFCRLTGKDLTLDYQKRQWWHVWLKYRECEPFTEADLELVIRFLRNEIKKGERKPACLKFRNMICNPDYFEDDLQDARGWARRPVVDSGKASLLRATGRPETPPNDHCAPISQHVAGLLAKFKAEHP